MSQFTGIAAELMARARGNLMRDGSLANVVVFVHPRGVDAFPLADWPSYLWPLVVQRFTEDQFKDYTAVFWVSEAWMKTNPADINRPASSYEDKEEVIIVQGKMRG